ncbi:MAG TPA: PD-(D/E)XK nuclease family protein, partial [Phycisphaerae bacterium]|nr:PD-(D/E)XK nuclease family protein [Phycisphaerae bacterium]
MSVRFVVGRAGSGKTWRCLEAVRAALREDAARGGRLILLVPEQASFQMERALVETPDVPGFTRCEVLSFRRLAHRIFAETGADSRRGDETIGPLGRLMVIRRLMRQQRKSLRLLGEVADKPGLVKHVAGTIEELMRENVEPQALADQAAKMEAGNPLGAAKLADVTRLYLAYVDYLIDDRLDPAQYLNLATRRLDACPWLAEADVWVDGFAGFTRQEADLLIALARRVRRMEIALLVDPDASAVEASRPPDFTLSLFARTERTLINLRNEMRSAGVAVEEPVRLKARTSPRFTSDELAALERRLFGAEGAESRIESASHAAVQVLSLPNRRCEAEAAVAEIQRLTREGDPPMRYRDIAVIVRDLDAYQDLLSAAMRSAGIPCFIDRRQSTAYHPLIELIRSLLAIAADDCRCESVRLSLKTGLLPIESGQADLLENYLIAHGINGRSRWDEVWTHTRIFRRVGEGGELNDVQRVTLERVNEARRAYLAAVGSWVDDASAEAGQTGRTWATRLFECLERIEVRQTLRTWTDRADEDGETEQAETHRQVWTDFVELLDEFVRALGQESMTIDAFRETIEAALSEFDLGLAPPTLDQVVVGAIERSRQPQIRAALLLGFDHLHYPRRRSEDPLLGDVEREALEDAGVPVGASRRRQMLDERLLAYIALTRASKRLWISFPQSDAEGQPIQPSPFLQEVLTALPGVRTEEPGDPRIGGVPAWISGVSDLGGRLAVEFRYRPVLDAEGEPHRRAAWNALYEAARRRPEWRTTLTRALAGLRYRNDARLDVELVGLAVGGGQLVASVSRLEAFARCPFAHCADYWLRLEPRVEAEMKPTEVGTVCHAILERFAADLLAGGTGLAELGDDEIAERVDAAAVSVRPLLDSAMMLDHARNAFLIDRGRSYMERVGRWQRDAARAGRFRPWKVEYPFGFAGRGSGVLALTTPKGRTILLRGRIDRVDLADLGDELLGAVIDYKT